MCIKPNRCDRPPRLISALIPFCAPLCGATYDCHTGLRSVGPFRTSWDCTTSCTLSKLARVELSVRLLLGFFSLGEGGRGHELQTEIMLHSHQLLHSKTTIVKALKLWFHRGDCWNREGTKVGLIQLHRSQYYSNTTYRLKDECLWSARCLMNAHPALHWVGYWVWMVAGPEHGDEAGHWRKRNQVQLMFLKKNVAKKLYWQETRDSEKT